jgi:hypothetical protein
MMKKIILLATMLGLMGSTLQGQNSTMTIREVFDFQPGDIFHRKIYRIYPTPPEAVRFEVLSRAVAPGNDTICYTMRHFDYTSEWLGQLVYTHHNYIQNVCYTNLDSMVHTLIDTFGMITSPINTFFEATYLDSLRCDSLTYRFEAKYGHLFEPAIARRAYGKGLGITEYLYDYYYSLPPTHQEWRVVYFKKGPYGCGTPDTVSTGIEEPLVSGFRCYPNPASSRINFEFDEAILLIEKQLTLVNTLGQEVMREAIPGVMLAYSFNIASLPAGTYFVRLEGPGFPGVTRKLLKTL